MQHTPCFTEVSSDDYKIICKVQTNWHDTISLSLIRKEYHTLFITSTLLGWVQKQSWTETNVMPSLSQNREVNIMWLESKEWMKFGGKAFFCFITFGRLKQIRHWYYTQCSHSYLEYYLLYPLKMDCNSHSNKGWTNKAVLAT